MQRLLADSLIACSLMSPQTTVGPKQCSAERPSTAYLSPQPPLHARRGGLGGQVPSLTVGRKQGESGHFKACAL